MGSLLGQGNDQKAGSQGLFSVPKDNDTCNQTVGRKMSIFFSIYYITNLRDYLPIVREVSVPFEMINSHFMVTLFRVCLSA